MHRSHHPLRLLVGRVAASAVVALTFGWPCAVFAQAPIEEVELTDSELTDTTSPAIDRSELERLVAEAELVFAGADRPAALPLYGRVVDILEAEQGASTTRLDEAGKVLWTRSLLRRAQIYAALGERELAETALTQRFRVDPSATVDPLALGVGDIVTDDFVRLAESVRVRSIGEITVRIIPADALVTVDGIALENVATDQLAATGEATVAVAPGLHAIAITRPGYTPIQRELEVEAGRGLSIEEELERVSPVLRLATRPSGAEVVLDGRSLGFTDGTADEGFLPQGAGTVYRREDFSDELVLDGLELGLRRLEVRHPGHRPYRIELQIDQPIDYRMPPIVLERERGQLVFADFPPGARIRVDGEPFEPDVRGVSRPRVTLEPGSYLVTVDSGTGMFSTRLELADRQTMEVRVQLRPGLTLLGVLGSDDDSARGLGQSLRLKLAESDIWTIIDRSPEAPSVLDRLGLDAERLRSPSPESVDWKAVQATMDRELPGLLYVLAVLDNDLMATRATLYIWSAAPGPSRPDTVTLPLRDPRALGELRQLIERPLPRATAWLGALAIDSDAEPHPVIAHVTPASPAEAAGLLVGDRVLGLGGVPITRRSDLDDRVRAAAPGEAVDVAIQRADGTRTVRVTLGASPRTLPHDPTLPRAIAWAGLQRLVDAGGPGSVGTEESWLTELDRGLLLLASGDAAAAVQVLRSIRGPQASHGLGQAAVDYTLGMALSRLGPELRDAAIQSLRRAAGLPGARLDHHDGPFLQPRARARLRMLGERPGG